MLKNLAFAIIFLSFSLMACQKAPDEKIALDAYGRTTKIAAIVLKSPPNAVFPPYTASFIKVLPDDVYEISSYVDVPNAAGAGMRTNYVCTLQHTPRDKESLWKLLAFKIEPRQQP